MTSYFTHEKLEFSMHLRMKKDNPIVAVYSLSN